jgi:hypothetical protein
MELPWWNHKFWMCTAPISLGLPGEVSVSLSSNLLTELSQCCCPSNQLVSSCLVMSMLDVQLSDLASPWSWFLQVGVHSYSNSEVKFLNTHNLGWVRRHSYIMYAAAEPDPRKTQLILQYHSFDEVSILLGCRDLSYNRLN